MLRCRFSFIALLLVPLCAPAQPKAPYYPDAAWQRRTPAEAGIDAQRLKDAVAYAVANETRNPRDLTLNHYQTFGREPFGYAIGPIKDRGEQTGVVVLKGYIVAEWGEPLRVDMTHSVTKSLLSSVVVYVDPDHDVVAVLRWIERKPAPAPLDTVSAIYEFANGASGLLGTVRATPQYWRVHVFGANGSAEALGESELVLHGAASQRLSLEPVDSLRAELEMFANAIETRAAFPISAAQMLATVAAFEATIRSLESDATVILD